jgi:predicted porin
VKKILTVGLLGAATATSAWAQSSVQLYGSLDVGVGYINNVAGHAKWLEEQGNMQPDRWGFKGTEDLGDGLSAIFQLENGFYTNTGNMAKANTLFNRQAYVGLADTTYGTFTLGNQTPFSFDVLGPMSTAYQACSWYAFHPGNIDELADTGIVPYNNSFKYRSTNFGGFTLGAMIGLGNDTNFSTGRNESVALTYTYTGFKAAATYADEHNRTFSMSTTGLSSFQGQVASAYAADTAQNMGAGVSYQIGALLVHGLYTRVKLESGAHSDTYQSYDAGANYQFTVANQVAGGAATTTLDGKRWTQFEIGDIYSLSKSTQLYANVLYEHATGANAAFFTAGASSTPNQVIFVAGMHHLF